MRHPGSVRSGADARAEAGARIVAITGHRRLPDAVAVASSIKTVLSELVAAPTNAQEAPQRLVLLSPLAEGADRVAAHAVLQLAGGVLRAILPLAPLDYEADFPTPSSRAEFRDLLAAAAEVEVLAPRPSRAEAYRAAGYRVVDDCDIVLAVWDGCPSHVVGGTAETVAYARKLGKPLIVIDSQEPSQVLRERLPGAGKDSAR